jgi:hypothetical protein
MSYSNSRLYCYFIEYAIMKRVGAAFVVVWLGLSLVFSAGTAALVDGERFIPSHLNNQGPTIDWHGPVNSSEERVIAWDGIYNGQTEQTFHQGAWINDTDGVDTVVVMMRDYGNTDWTNFTPTLLEGNDTLGYETETGVLGYTGGYMEVIPPQDVVFISIVIPTLFAAVVIVVIISVVIILRRR